MAKIKKTTDHHLRTDPESNALNVETALYTLGLHGVLQSLL